VETRRPYPWQEKRGMKVCDIARTLGVWLRPLHDVIVVMPPLSIAPEQLDQIATAVEAGIQTATR
jgi:adenosylmethionine---8-amino-7-oxononanoate aminotransferase